MKDILERLAVQLDGINDIDNYQETVEYIFEFLSSRLEGIKELLGSSSRRKKYLMKGTYCDSWVDYVFENWVARRWENLHPALFSETYRIQCCTKVKRCYMRTYGIFLELGLGDEDIEQLWKELKKLSYCIRTYEEAR